mmetsp:Transcript_27222/g.69149  ORF Transcript_27222/g.69149 Transcript_27222/m.69149 type:complete len:219 (+) Transcript_27222:253-909(+)
MARAHTTSRLSSPACTDHQSSQPRATHRSEARKGFQCPSLTSLAYFSRQAELAQPVDVIILARFHPVHCIFALARRRVELREGEEQHDEQHNDPKEAEEEALPLDAVPKRVSLDDGEGLIAEDTHVRRVAHDRARARPRGQPHFIVANLLRRRAAAAARGHQTRVRLCRSHEDHEGEAESDEAEEDEDPFGSECLRGAHVEQRQVDVLEARRHRRRAV